MKQIARLKDVRQRRARRARAKAHGTPARPRLAVFRGNRGFYAQLIDDTHGHTLAAASSTELKKTKSGSKTDVASQIGTLLAARAREAGITKAVFDRRAYAYHGRVRSFAEAVRKGGVEF